MSDIKEQLAAQSAALAIPEIVLQKCLDRPLGSVLLSRIYGVPSGWEAKELPQAKGIHTVGSNDALEKALASSEYPEIFILATAGIPLDELKQRLETQSIPKTIFIEK